MTDAERNQYIQDVQYGVKLADIKEENKLLPEDERLTHSQCLEAQYDLAFSSRLDGSDVFQMKTAVEMKINLLSEEITEI